ncbi:hypothetical protein APHAL10511_003852 [Amanita phalloides]|nr:hypothetical protein APHAL10511_003852 [Amanita phalloides]
MNLQVLFVIVFRVSLTVAVAAPTVTLDDGTFTGVAAGSISKFRGIPFAQPPVRNLRFRFPQPLPPYVGTHQAVQYGPACPQQALSISSLPPGIAQSVGSIINTAFGPAVPSGEDCLTLNVIVPSNTTPQSKIPVVVWIYGGGFEAGYNSMYDGSEIVNRSIELGEPVIYVSMNYRVSGFGFLASREVKAAGVGNLGLQDQRLSFQWIQKYISAFGGDPAKVTIWGESAGAISVALHMLYDGGNTGGLFRAGFMQSGSPIPVGPIEHGQKYYDFVVQKVGCSTAADTLDCLRTVHYDALKAAFDATPGYTSYRSTVLTYLSRVDGVFLTDDPQRLVSQGKVANIPFVTGDCDDEGTVFALSTLNITTDYQLEIYIKTIAFPNITDDDYQRLARAYPSDVTQGSPFDTGYRNILTPQFKRIAALIGDITFQAPRRHFLNQLSGKQDTWAFLSKREKMVPGLGSFHTTDLLNIYFGGELADYLIRFANNLNPNGPNTFFWPQYNTSTRSLLTFFDGLIPIALTQDTYRQEAMNVALNVTLANPM